MWKNLPLIWFGEVQHLCNGSANLTLSARMFLQTIRSRILHKSVCEEQELRSLYRDKDWAKLPSAWNVNEFLTNAIYCFFRLLSLALLVLEKAV